MPGARGNQAWLITRPVTVPTVKHDGASIMLWECFAVARNDRLVTIEEKMKAVIYKDVLDENLVLEFIFQ